MALNIKTQLATREGFQVFPSYARINYGVSHDGKHMFIGVNYWVDENAFRTNLNYFSPLNPNIDGFQVAYNREIDGDALTFAHEQAKILLEEKGILADIVL